MKALIAGLVVAGFVHGTAAGQGISLNRAGSGARAAGMGNAFIAVSDDGTAASWNPAGLSQLRRPELSVVYAGTFRHQRFDGFRTLDRRSLFTALGSGTTTGTLEFASAAVPFSVLKRPVTIQAGWRRLYDFRGGVEGEITRVPISAGSRPASVIYIDNESGGNISLATLAGAIQVTNELSVGGGIDFYRGHWSDRLRLVETPGFVDAVDSATTAGTNEIGSHAFNFGVLLAWQKIRAGLVYHGRLRTPFEVTRTGRSNLVAPIDTRVDRDDGMALRLPSSIGVGVAWLPRPLLRVALDVTYDRWTRFLIEGAPDSNGRPQSGFDGLPPELTATRNTVTINAGVERLFPVAERLLPLRLGVSREPQGARDPFLRVDANHTVLAAGTGLNSNTLKIDVSFEYRWGRFDQTMALTPIYQVGGAEELGEPLPPESQGSIRFREIRLKLSMIYRIARRERAGS